MRLKREEAERQKKEQAREQKRLEREERDQKLRKGAMTNGRYVSHISIANLVSWTCQQYWYISRDVDRFFSCGYWFPDQR
jgi:hypothetical protein